MTSDEFVGLLPIRYSSFEKFINLFFSNKKSCGMTFVEKHQCLERLKEWLRKGRAGSLEELADAFDVSTRTVKRWIADLRNYEGWDIEYNRILNKYMLRETR